jgi:hypothetical protein
MPNNIIENILPKERDIPKCLSDCPFCGRKLYSKCPAYLEDKEYNRALKDCRSKVPEIIEYVKKETLKELIREYQDNELDGKGYDFYFSIRTKIDSLSTNQNEKWKKQ